MAIKFECPNPGCKRKLSVKDELAGKKGKCPGCQKGITIPAVSSVPVVETLPVPNSTTPAPEPQPAPQLPTPPRVDGPVRTQEEIDLEAAEALSDKPPEEDAPPQEITFECPMCSEKITLKADLAGKRAPCPECRRIVKVPELEKKKGPKDWRQFDRKPGGVPDEPAPEGAWGTADKEHVHRESLEEAGVIQAREKPVPRWVKLYPWWIVLTAGILTLSVTARTLRWLSSSYEEKLVTITNEYLKEARLKEPLSAAAVHRALGAYLFLQKKNEPDSVGPKAKTAAALAKEHCDAALSILVQAGENSSGNDRDAGLLDLCQTLLEFSADKKSPAVERGERLDRDEAFKGVATALRSMTSQEARREAVRLLARQLITLGQPERAFTMASQASNNPAERADAQAVAGLELYTADNKSAAERAADLCLQPYAGSDAPPITPAVVALALLMQKKPPTAPEGSLQVEDDYSARTEAQAREGKLDAARAHSAAAPRDRVKFRCLVGIATATGTAADVEAAVGILEGPLRSTLGNTSSWLVYRLVQLGTAAKMPADRLRAIAALAPDPVLRARGGVVVLTRDLAGAKEVKSVDTETEKIDAAGLGRLLATEIICRHNVTMNSSWGNDIQDWKDPRRAFAAAGVLQGRYFR